MARDRKLASHASGAWSLNRRIQDMENRLMVERAEVVAHTREFGGGVKRRLTSPTSLVFAGSMGFIAAEILGARQGKSGKRGKSRLLSAGKTAGRTLFGSLAKPLLSMAQVASVGFLAKQGKEASDAARGAAEEPPPTLH